MNKRKNSQGKRTKETVILAAIKVMSSKGAHNINLQDIANEAGVERSLVAYHFEDKNLVFGEVWNYIYEKALVETERHVNSTKAHNASEKLSNYFQISISFFTSKKEIMILYFQLHYMAVFDDKLKLINTQVKQRAIHRIAKIIIEGQKNGEFTPHIDPYLQAKSIHSSLVGIAINSVSEFEQFNLNEILNTFIRHTLIALKHQGED